MSHGDAERVFHHSFACNNHVHFAKPTDEGSPDNVPFPSSLNVAGFATTSILVGQTVGAVTAGAVTAGAVTATAGAVGGTTATAEFALADNGIDGGRTAATPPIGSGVGRGP